MADISQIRLNDGLYNIKDDTHEVELPLNFYKNSDLKAQLDTTTGNNPETRLSFITDTNLQATSYNNSSDVTKAGIYFHGINNSNAETMGGWLVFSEGSSEGRVSTGLGVARYDTNGDLISNGFRIRVYPNGESHYNVTSPFNFRSDISTPSQVKSVGNTTTNISVATGTNVNMRSLELTSGLWIVTGALGYAINTTGRRAIKLSDISADTANTISTWGEVPISGSVTRLNTSQAFYVAEGTTKTVYLIAWQNSGGNLNCTAMLQACLV